MLNAKLKVAVISHDITWGDKDENIITVAELLNQIEKDTDVVVLPELFSTGFISVTEQLYDMAENTSGPTILTVQRWAQYFNVAICGSLLMKSGGDFYNRAFFVEPSGDTIFYDKRHLFDNDLEKKCYTPGKTQAPIFRYRGWNISMAICYDIKFPVWCRNVKEKIDLMLVPANWPKENEYEWKHLLIARAIENQYYVVGANRSGADDVGDYLNSYIFNFKGSEISIQSVVSHKIIYAKLIKEDLTNYRKTNSIVDDADLFEIVK